MLWNLIFRFNVTMIAEDKTLGGVSEMARGARWRERESGRGREGEGEIERGRLVARDTERGGRNAKNAA
jgi:hypothetical protein